MCLKENSKYLKNIPGKFCQLMQKILVFAPKRQDIAIQILHRHWHVPIQFCSEHFDRSCHQGLGAFFARLLFGRSCFFTQQFSQCIFIFIRTFALQGWSVFLLLCLCSCCFFGGWSSACFVIAEKFGQEFFLFSILAKANHLVIRVHQVGKSSVFV